jgi:hypothetical protein
LHCQKENIMDNNVLLLLSKFGLVKTGNRNYSDSANAFLGNGYTSNVGNNYFSSVRLIEGIAIKEDVGQGYAHTFLNAIRVYDATNKKIICECNYHCKIYDETFVQKEVVRLLTATLIQASIESGLAIDYYSTEYQVNVRINDGFSLDQRQVWSNKSSTSLN